MLFNSISYAIFLPLVFVSYWIIPYHFRWIVLLLSSYLFYMLWNPKYILLIIFTTVISFYCGILLEKSARNIAFKNLLLTISLIACLGMLFVFKYYDFAVLTIRQLTPFMPSELKLLLPVGISFYTFQSLSYVIDVYRGDCCAETNLGVYAAYVSFFPQLIAGPIERTNHLLPQIHDKHDFNKDDFYCGIQLILWGLYKKMLIADNLAIYVDSVFEDIYSFSGFSIALAAIFFSFQIYCDFSGYSDIARGSAQLLGIRLIDNFKSPYFATSLKDFWNRWHISLSTWFRDYLYIPLGGNRVPRLRSIINVMITFLISGLWHGANWNFVAWGGIHGLARIFEDLLGIRKAQHKRSLIWLNRLTVFLFISFAWIFFRANNLQDALYAVKSLTVGISKPHKYIFDGLNMLNIQISSLPLFLIQFVPLSIIDYLSFKKPIEAISVYKKYILYLSSILMVIAMLFWGYVGKSTFVYFQF